MKLLAGNVMIVTLLLSASIHALSLGILSQFPSNLDREKESEIYEIAFLEREKPPLLPEIDIMGEEKKIPPQKLFEKRNMKEQEFQELSLEPEFKVEDVDPVAESVIETEEKIEELMIEKTKAESVEEEIKTLKDQLLSEVEVLNPSEEVMLRYQDIVKQKIEAVRRYPLWAEKRGIKGRAHIIFIINTDGNCREVELVRSSNSPLLDREAITTIKRANPFPPLPDGIDLPYVQMNVEIVFSLK